MTDIIMKVKKENPFVYKILNVTTGEYCHDETGKENYAFTMHWAEYLLDRYTRDNKTDVFKIVRIIKHEL